MATALAREVVLKGMRARFYSVVDLVNQLDAEKREGRAGRLARYSDGDRQFVDILSMVALYGLEAVSDACAVALEEQVVSSAHVVNLLHRAAAPPRLPPLQVPEALKLIVEPAANCERYNQLLRVRPTTIVPVEPT